MKKKPVKTPPPQVVFRAGFFAPADGLLAADAREQAVAAITRWHYAHSFPSGKSHIFKVGPALVVYSIPANKNLGTFVLGRAGAVWELTRLWAPDGHAPNLLTQAILRSIGYFRQIERKVEALVSFADPNVGHKGGIYRAASWVYTGQSEEARYYRDKAGQVVSRRKFHSGTNAGLKKAEIEARGYKEHKLPGKYRFVKGLTAAAKRDIAGRWGKA